MFPFYLIRVFCAEIFQEEHVQNIYEDEANHSVDTSDDESFNQSTASQVTSNPIPFLPPHNGHKVPEIIRYEQVCLISGAFKITGTVDETMVINLFKNSTIKRCLSGQRFIYKLKRDRTFKFVHQNISVSARLLGEEYLTVIPGTVVKDANQESYTILGKGQVFYTPVINVDGTLQNLICLRDGLNEFTEYQGVTVQHLGFDYSITTDGKVLNDREVSMPYQLMEPVVLKRQKPSAWHQFEYMNLPVGSYIYLNIQGQDLVGRKRSYRFIPDLVLPIIESMDGHRQD